MASAAATVLPGARVGTALSGSPIGTTCAPSALLEPARLARAFKVFFLRVTMFYQNPEQNILQDELS